MFTMWRETIHKHSIKGNNPWSLWNVIGAASGDFFLVQLTLSPKVSSKCLHTWILFSVSYPKKEVLTEIYKTFSLALYHKFVSGIRNLHLFESTVQLSTELQKNHCPIEHDDFAVILAFYLVHNFTKKCDSITENSINIKNWLSFLIFLIAIFAYL